MRRLLPGGAFIAISLALAAGAPVGEGAASNARPASRSERSAIVAAYKATDGNTSGVRGVFVSRSNTALAVVCVRTPEAGTRAYVFHHSGRRWSYLISGSVGNVGNSTERTLERACG